LGGGGVCLLGGSRTVVRSWELARRGWVSSLGDPTCDLVLLFIVARALDGVPTKRVGSVGGSGSRIKLFAQGILYLGIHALSFPLETLVSSSVGIIGK